MIGRIGPASMNVAGYDPKPIGSLLMGEELPENKAAFERAFDRAFGPRILQLSPQWRPSDDVCPLCFTVKIAGVCRRCCP